MNRRGEEGYVFCASDITKEKLLEAELVRISENEQRRIGQDIHDDLFRSCPESLHDQGAGAATARSPPGGGADDDGHHRNGGPGRHEGSRDRQGAGARGLGDPGTFLGPPRAGGAEEGASSVSTASRTFPKIRGSSASSERIAIQLYRIAQEAMTNAIRHSDAEVIELSLKILDGHVELKVRDNGKGMAREPAGSGMGLMTMRRRAEMIDADFSIQASPGGGDPGPVQCSLES